MDQGEDRFTMVEGPVVTAADPWDPESRTADLSRAAELAVPATDEADPLVPPLRSGLPGLLTHTRGAVRRCLAGLLGAGLVAALPMHFFVGRVDDTVIAAPALSDLLGGFGLLLLPLMWLAYFTVSALPLVICLAGATAVAVAEAATGSLPSPRAAARLVAYRLRPLWLWFAAFGVVTQALPLLLTTDRLGPAVAAPLAAGLALISTAVLTFLGMLGCVVLIERDRGPRRAAHLCSPATLGGPVLASLAVTVLPRLAEAAWGAIASTVVAVVSVLLWAITAMVAYAQARRAEGPVTSASLFAELSRPELD
ncbi:hypothetical protein ACQP2F_44050 [Actinoplanes sp. CA-030573]|uniref:hypothetical protein n=1 Tax=Actinoplanes sp. CA-030573 TaxID=3239898 RepID=UPI003D90EEB5